MTAHLYVWTGIDDPSRKGVAQVDFGDDGMRAAGSSITSSYETSWTLDVGPDWKTRRIVVTATGRTWSRYLALNRSESGAWLSETAARGEADLPAPGIAEDADLGEAAVDCDLGQCPLTNVMPIRRLGLQQKVVPDTPLVMAWIDVPSLRVIRSDQVYGSRPTAGKVRYTSYSRDFSAEITVDSHGIVLDYPDLALRSDYSSN